MPLFVHLENGNKALMFRIVNTRSNILMELEATVMFMRFVDDENGQMRRKYFPLKLKQAKETSFP